MAQARQYPFQKIIKTLLPPAVARRLDRRIKLYLCDAVVVSYPKCGRTWLRAMLTLYFARLYGTPKDLLIDFANLHLLDPRVPRIYFSHEVDYKGAPAGVRIDRRRLARKKLIFLARDPRDVIVSLYAHRVHRDRDWEGPLEAFIDADEGGLATALRYYQLWNDFLAGHREAVVLRYEDVHADPAAALATVLRHLGQAVDEAALDACIEESAFDRLKRMEARSEFRSGRLSARNLDNPQAAKVRRGIVGGFVEDLNPATARAVGRRMESHLRGAFGYRAGHIAAGQQKGESSGAEN